ncbi:hypothetical protein PtB15_6B639 [Puccinia triticina]|nr:hypothetical protein PtB15_6B639 [Puccinia triticina]
MCLLASLSHQRFPSQRLSSVPGPTSTSGYPNTQPASYGPGGEGHGISSMPAQLSSTPSSQSFPGQLSSTPSGQSLPGQLSSMPSSQSLPGQLSSMPSGQSLPGHPAVQDGAMSAGSPGSAGTGANGGNSYSSRIFDFRLTPYMKSSDLDNPSLSLSKLITYVVKGAASPLQYVSVSPQTSELEIQIRDDSIFAPTGGLQQDGFRQTDVLPAINKATTLSGTIRLDSRAPLALAHGYLLASIELPVGDHVFDIFTGSDFDSQNTAHTPSSNHQTIRVRDLSANTLYSVPLSYNQAYNFAITVDWNSNTLTVYASSGNSPLSKVAGQVRNDPKVLASANRGTGEYHLQIIKFPLPNPQDPVSQRSDVPHHGIREPIRSEAAFFSKVFVTSGSQIEQPSSRRHRTSQVLLTTVFYERQANTLDVRDGKSFRSLRPGLALVTLDPRSGVLLNLQELDGFGTQMLVRMALVDRFPTAILSSSLVPAHVF